MDNIVKKIIDASYHRNGICGAGFWAILFESTETKDMMIASLFDESGYCAIYSVAQLVEKNIKFARDNSWRGDRFEDELRPMLKTWLEKNKSNRIGPFSVIPTDVIEAKIEEA